MAVSVQKYTVNSKTLLGRLIPFFLRGKRMLQFLSAISSPLDDVNKAFQSWAYNTLVDAATTSQVIVLKWALKNKFGQYFYNEDDEFSIDTYARNDYATLYEDRIEMDGAPEHTIKQVYMPENNADTTLGGEEVKNKVILRDKNEIISESNEVLIAAPMCNKRITEEMYQKMIERYIEQQLVYDVEYKVVISKTK
mgnify:CR=1 FL=1|jgi:hypothetical protein